MKLAGLALLDHGLPSGSVSEIARPSIEELNALRDVEVVDIAPLAGVDRAIVPPAAADHLRFPLPPVRAANGHALYANLGRAVACFEGSRERPVAASREAVVAEARMMNLLRGIHGLEQDIRQEISRRARA